MQISFQAFFPLPLPLFFLFLSLFLSLSSLERRTERSFLGEMISSGQWMTKQPGNNGGRIRSWNFTNELIIGRYTGRYYITTWIDFYFKILSLDKNRDVSVFFPPSSPLRFIIFYYGVFAIYRSYFSSFYFSEGGKGSICGNAVHSRCIVMKLIQFIQLGLKFSLCK